MQGLDLGLEVLLPEEAELPTDEVSTRESEIIALQYKHVIAQEQQKHSAIENVKAIRETISKHGITPELELLIGDQLNALPIDKDNIEKSVENLDALIKDNTEVDASVEFTMIELIAAAVVGTVIIGFIGKLLKKMKTAAEKLKDSIKQVKDLSDDEIKSAIADSNKSMIPSKDGFVKYTSFAAKELDKALKILLVDETKLNINQFDVKNLKNLGIMIDVKNGNVSHDESYAMIYKKDTLSAMGWDVSSIKNGMRIVETSLSSRVQQYDSLLKKLKQQKKASTDKESKKKIAAVLEVVMALMDIEWVLLYDYKDVLAQVIKYA